MDVGGKLRILHVVPSVDPADGGPSVAVPLLALASAQREHRVTIVTTIRGQRSEVGPQRSDVRRQTSDVRRQRRCCQSFLQTLPGVCTMINAPEGLERLMQTMPISDATANAPGGGIAPGPDVGVQTSDVSRQTSDIGHPAAAGKLQPEVGDQSQRVHPLRKMAQEEWAPALLILFCDVVCWVGIYTALGFIRHDQFFSSQFEFAILNIIQLAVIVQSLFIIGGYNNRTEMRGLGYTTEHILAMIVAFGVSSLILYAAATFDQVMKPSRSAVLISFILFTPVSLMYRRMLRKKVTSASANRAFLVIGAGELAANFYRTYRSAGNAQRLEFVDLDEKRVGEPIAGPNSPVIEGSLALKLSGASKKYSGIILAERIERIRPDLLESLVRTQFQRTRVYTLESFYEAHWRRVPVLSIDPFWPLQSGFQLSRTSPYHYLKRLFDIVASGALFVICSPLLVALTCLVWLTSGRPAIFRQTRVGRDGQTFTAYKFRTMEMRFAETDDIYTRQDDPRITAIGRVLRKLRLDELPQFWNVLKGDLSLIGPRAEWIKCAERYEKKIPFYHFRHLVKPGITGWAQVNYPYGESDEDAIEKLKYDLYYIRHYSLKLDAMIVLKTVYTMLFGKGR
jgi:exopolysaccharide biosynthesis polyprenyl glycosylphosphotransferase